MKINYIVLAVAAATLSTLSLQAANRVAPPKASAHEVLTVAGVSEQVTGNPEQGNVKAQELIRTTTAVAGGPTPNLLPKGFVTKNSVNSTFNVAPLK